MWWAEGTTPGCKRPIKINQNLFRLCNFVRYLKWPIINKPAGWEAECKGGGAVKSEEYSGPNNESPICDSAWFRNTLIASSNLSSIRVPYKKKNH